MTDKQLLTGNQSSLTDRLAEIEKREKAATPGPWQERFWVGPIEGPDGKKAYITGHGPLHEYREAGNLEAIHDSEFIAHARTDVPWLIAQVREANERADRMQGHFDFACGELDRWRHDYNRLQEHFYAERDAALAKLKTAVEVIEGIKRTVDIDGGDWQDLSALNFAARLGLIDMDCDKALKADR